MTRHLSVFILALPLIGAPAMGQTPEALQMSKAGAVWFNSSNTAGMTVTSITPFEAIDVNYHIADGEHRSYTEGNSRNLTINAEGATSLWKGKVWGKFSYCNITERDTRYNTLSLTLDEDNPFFVADDVLSWWKKQKYELQMKASTPLYWDRVGFGIEASYFSESGAKQIDPRGYGNEYSLCVKPAAILKFGRHYAGIVIDYENGNMRMTPTNNAYMNSRDAYILHGLGNNEASLISLVSTGVGQVFDTKNQYGASLQYSYLSDTFRILADMFASMRVWDLSHTPNRPEAIGSTKRIVMGGNIQAVSENRSFRHKLVASMAIRNTDGIEYVQVFNKDYNVQAYETVAKNVKSRYSRAKAAVSYDMTRKSHDSYNWTVGAEAEYNSRNDRYLIPVSTFDCSHLYVELHGRKQFFLKRMSMSVGANAGYCLGLDSEYSYQGASASTPIVTDYFPHELSFLSASYICAGIDYKVSFDVLTNSTMFAGLGAKMLKTGNNQMKNRNIADISIGFVF